MSLAEALHGMLALMPAEQVLAKNVRLEVTIQDSCLGLNNLKRLVYYCKQDSNIILQLWC